MLLNLSENYKMLLSSVLFSFNPEQKEIYGALWSSV